MNATRARYESHLSRAAAQVFHAMAAADQMNDEGARCDLQMIREHLQVMMEESLRPRKHRPRPDLELRAQMTVDDVLEDIKTA